MVVTAAVGICLLGAMDVAWGASYRPTAGSVAPSSGSGYSAVFTTRFYDRNGWRNLSSVRMLLGPALWPGGGGGGGAGSGGAYLIYSQNANRFYLYDGVARRGGYRPRANATISTAWATLDLRDSYPTGSGTRLIVRWRVRFRSALYGASLHAYLHAKDDRGVSSGWRARGVWDVPEHGPGAAGTLPAIFPSDNPWNTDVSTWPVDANSADYIASIGPDTGLHPDFGTVWEGAPIGIPYTTVSATQPAVPISFYYPDESEPGPYPIPADAPIEGGPYGTGDRHILIVDTDNRLLYEIYDAHKVAGGWAAGSGAIFDLTSNALRPDYWTSADAAGLPIFPGLARYDEVQSGEIRHALRFTVSRTQRGFIHPATHFASDETDPDLPPMGLRVRLKAGVDITGFSPEVRVVLTALKRYGMFVADNGADWYITGAPDPRWNDEELHRLDEIKGSDFEVADTGPIIH